METENVKHYHEDISHIYIDNNTYYNFMVRYLIHIENIRHILLGMLFTLSVMAFHPSAKSYFYVISFFMFILSFIVSMYFLYSKRVYDIYLYNMKSMTKPYQFYRPVKPIPPYLKSLISPFFWWYLLPVITSIFWLYITTSTIMISSLKGVVVIIYLFIMIILHIKYFVNIRPK